MTDARNRSSYGLAATLGLIGLLFQPVSAAADSPTTSPTTSPRPHILIILADDLGWRDVGYHGSEISTPQIDRIARQGVELDRFYVQPTCSPTRAGLMTGKSPLRLGIHRPISKNQTTGLPLDETLLPEHLARLGYQSLMVGKWHLGHYLPKYFPNARGFEHFYGHVTGGIGYWDHNHGGGHDWQRNGENLREDGYSTNLLRDEAIRIIRNRDRERPTFLYLSFDAPHLPNEAPEEAVARYASIQDPNRRTHAAMVSELDAAIGRVLEVYESEGMLDNTIILFSSDNGGLNPETHPAGLRRAAGLFASVFGRPIPSRSVEFLVSNLLDGASDNRPLALGKATVGEGGARVPAAIWWPGRLEGGLFDRFMTISDVLPTLLDAIGATDSIPPDLDGSSQWAALRNQRAADADIPDYLITGMDSLAIYRSPWKLVDPDSPRLYQIYEDPSEQKDLAADHPELVKSLVQAARSWPRGPDLGTSLLELLRDPDSFGGPEDREPWAVVARRRADAN